MRIKFLDKLRGLGRCTSGNAVVLVALGLPMLIGGAGLGTDVAQWFMWKRELQYAVDQAAIAGAWAKSSSKTSVQLTYRARALQEYNANLNLVGDFDDAAGPTIALAYYRTAPPTADSVEVTATATKSLPFSNMLTNRVTTITAHAQATWQASADFHACMFALNRSAKSAFKMGNSINGSSTCGAGTLSNNTQSAMTETGDSTVPLGSLVARGAVDQTFKNNGDLFGNQPNISDPYDGLSAPSAAGQPVRTYPATCPVITPASTTYKSDGLTWTHFTYKYYKGANSSNWTLQGSYAGAGYIANYWSPTPQANYSAGVWTPVANGNYTNGIAFAGRSAIASTTVGLQAESVPANGTAVSISGSGSNKYWRLPSTSTRDKITAVSSTTTPASDGIVHLQPGVYSAMTFACQTELTPGVYFVSGDLDLGANVSVTSTGGVMFVMTGSAGAIKVNGNSNVTLTGITATTLINNYGYSSAEAAKIAGMLIWDPLSTSAFTLNGNSTLHLSGIMYMPHRAATFDGTSSASGSCIMVAADTIKIEGNFSLNNFCVTTGGSAMSIGGSSADVQLIA
ncbi:MAG: pilus assembly protein TadG-related protein [Croceibacterium sp.]